MKITARVFLVFAGFFAAIGIVYWFWSYEWAGTALLALIVGATALVGMYLLRESQGPSLPEDRTDATPGDAAGETVGRFATGSIWPFVAAAGVMLVALGLVFSVYVAAPGAVLLGFAVVGMAREIPASGAQRPAPPASRT